MYSERSYRKDNASDLVQFRICIKETDLWIAIDKESYHTEIPELLENYVFGMRLQLEDYIKEYPLFYTSLVPCLLRGYAPAIPQTMIKASSVFGVGPMAAVAGTFADYVGKFLAEQCKEVIVENGGDIYIKTSEKERIISIFAGKSPFSNKIGIKIPKHVTRGICTSSATVGPSLSLGKTDATVIVSQTAALADAAATFLGNLVTDEAQLDSAINNAKKYREIIGAIVIINDKLGAVGKIEIVPLTN